MNFECRYYVYKFNDLLLGVSQSLIVKIFTVICPDYGVKIVFFQLVTPRAPQGDGVPENQVSSNPFPSSLSFSSFTKMV